MILAECPVCHKKQGTKNKKCECGADLDKFKKSGKVIYWIRYQAGGKRYKERIGPSIEEARDAYSQKRVKRREKRLFDIKPEYKTTFAQLTKWYLKLDKVASLKSSDTVKIYLSKFNSQFGGMTVSQIQPADLENHQARRKAEKLSDATIDHEIGAARTMIIKAFDNDLVGGETLRAFKKVKKLLKRNSNARDRILSPEEFEELMKHAPRHTKAILTVAYFTGMRLGEIFSLTWDKIDLEQDFICLEADDTKDKEARQIPITSEVHKIFKATPRAIHDQHVFLYKGKPLTHIRTGLRKACVDAGIEYGRFKKDGFVFHDLRHTFNTYMRKAGTPESVIMSITGHSTREMFDRYNTIDREDKKEAVKSLEKYLGATS